MKTITILVATGALACAAPALADDAPPSTTVPSAQEQCRAERDAMGNALFADTYGTNESKRNAFGKCVSRRAKQTETAGEEARAGAPEACRAERALDEAAFAEKYGTNKNKRNAFGKCVSTTAKAQQAEIVTSQTTAHVDAANACKAERALDKAAFAEKYGTNKNKRNAFGKCVSTTAKAA